MAPGIEKPLREEISREQLVEELSLAETAPRVARNLLGSYLVRETEEGTLRARIVETEAYREDDPASHSCRGPTQRSKVMFGPPGFWYIYKCYGIHWMINVVCGPEDSGEAVLIRAAEPCAGEKIMVKQRGKDGKQLTNGPGKLAEALVVDEEINEQPVAAGTGFYLQPGSCSEEIYTSRRVGIEVGVERPWRFYLQSEYVTETEHNVDT